MSSTAVQVTVDGKPVESAKVIEIEYELCRTRRASPPIEEVISFYKHVNGNVRRSIIRALIRLVGPHNNHHSDWGHSWMVARSKIPMEELLVDNREVTGICAKGLTQYSRWTDSGAMIAWRHISTEGLIKLYEFLKKREAKLCRKNAT